MQNSHLNSHMELLVEITVCIIFKMSMSWNHEYNLDYLDEVDRNYKKFRVFSQMISQFQPSIEQFDEALAKSKTCVDESVISTFIRSRAVVPLLDTIPLPTPPQALLYDDESVDVQVRNRDRLI